MSMNTILAVYLRNPYTTASTGVTIALVIDVVIFDLLN